MTSAIASRVMSSWVGPRPPHTMTPSLRASAVRKASTIRSWLSPTAWWKCESDAERGQVLTQPLRVGVGDLAEQELGADRHDLDPHVAQPPVRSAAVPTTAAARPRLGARRRSTAPR